MWRAPPQLDSTAMDMLMLALSPLVVGFALYSLIYDKHKSWYSWIVDPLRMASRVWFHLHDATVVYKLQAKVSHTCHGR